MIAMDMLEKYGRKSALITASIVGLTWLKGYWHNWSDLNYRLLYILFGIIILLVALASWILRSAKAIRIEGNGTGIDNQDFEPPN
jgi:uncharacterized protein (DUF58 family)